VNADFRQEVVLRKPECMLIWKVLKSGLTRDLSIDLDALVVTNHQRNR
jgi:hypothetical protein